MRIGGAIGIRRAREFDVSSRKVHRRLQGEVNFSWIITQDYGAGSGDSPVVGVSITPLKQQAKPAEMRWKKRNRSTNTNNESMRLRGSCTWKRALGTGKTGWWRL